MVIFINCEVYVPSKGSLIAFQAFLQRLKKPLSGGSAIKNSAFVRTTDSWFGSEQRCKQR
jgi:hypothetical protein